MIFSAELTIVQKIDLFPRQRQGRCLPVFSMVITFVANLHIPGRHTGPLQGKMFDLLHSSHRGTGYLVLFFFKGDLQSKTGAGGIGFGQF